MLLSRHLLYFITDKETPQPKSGMSAYKIKIAKEVPFVYIEQTSFAIFRLFYYNSPAFQQSIFKSYSALLYFTPVISFLPLIANNSETPTT